MPHRIPSLLFWSAVVSVLLITAPGHAQFRVASWNVARLNGDPTAIQDVFEAIAADDTPGYATAPHLYVFQEVRGEVVNDLGNLIDAAHPGFDYVRATFTTSSSEDGSGGAQALFYRSDRVTEVTFGHRDINTGAGRRTDRWQLRLVGYQFDLYVYSSHLKAGFSDTALRESGAETLRDDADGLPAGTHVIYIGDYNFYSNTEPGYQVLTAPGGSQAVDPLGTDNWTGASNAWKHTQSPRQSSGDGLVGGGMDDRFDQHLTTAGLQDGAGLSLLSYRALGNDGDHWDESINAGNNTYFPGQLARSNALADDLFDASDHIPVVVDYQFPSLVSTFLSDDQGTVIEGAAVSVQVLVANGAPGEVVDACPVYVEGISGIFGDDTIFDAARLPSFETVNLSLDTTTPGDVIGTVRVQGLGEDAGGALYEVSTNAVVLGHARPSFSGTALQTSADLALAYAVTDGAVQLDLPLHNFGYSSLQAALDFTSVEGLVPGVFVTGTPIGSITGTPKDLQLTIDPAVLGVGVFDLQLQIQLSDQDLPGAIGHQLDLGLEIVVEGDAPRPGDLNGDGRVDGEDLALLLGAWNTSTYDLDGDDIVSGSDLAIVLGDWGD